MDNLQLDQLQSAPVVEDLFGLRESSALLEGDNLFTRDDISHMLNAVCSGKTRPLLLVLCNCVFVLLLVV